MAINVGQPFKRTSPAPIDESLVLTKLQMLSVDDGEMPELYFAICLDDGCLYFYNKSATPNAETGKYTKQSTQGVVYTAGQGIDISDSDEISVDDTFVATKTDLDDYYTKAETDAKFSGLYHFKGHVPTYDDLPKTGMEEGDVYNVEEDGMNYAWDGQAWDNLGALIDLSAYYTKTEVDAELDKKIDKPTTKADGDILSYDEAEDKWVAIAPSTGSGSLENAITASIEVGGIKKNKTYAAGTSLEQMWKDLISPALNPTLTDPYVSIGYHNTTLLEVGDTIPATNIIVAFNRGTINPAYGTSGNRSGEATNYHVETNGAETDFKPADQTTGTFVAPTLTRQTPGNIVVTASVDYGAGEQPKNSVGENYSTPLAAGSKSSTKTYEFILPFYWGASDTATPDISKLTKDLTKKSNKTYSYTTSNQYIIFGYDKTYGNLSSILDQNGFETISGYDIIDEGSYRFYVSQLPTKDTGANNTFKF